MVMGAPIEVTYRIPKTSCPKFLEELHRRGLLLSSRFDLPDDGFTIHLQKQQSKGFAPFLIFSESRTDETAREIETMWTEQNRQLVEQIEDAVLQHGGTIVSGGVRDTK